MLLAGQGTAEQEAVYRPNENVKVLVGVMLLELKYPALHMQDGEPWALGGHCTGEHVTVVNVPVDWQVAELLPL